MKRYVGAVSNEISLLLLLWRCLESDFARLIQYPATESSAIINNSIVCHKNSSKAGMAYQDETLIESHNRATVLASNMRCIFLHKTKPGYMFLFLSSGG